MGLPEIAKNLKTNVSGASVTVSFDDATGSTWTFYDRNGDSRVDEIESPLSSIEPDASYQNIFTTAFRKSVKENFSLLQTIFHEGNVYTLQGYSAQPYGMGFTNKSYEVTGKQNNFIAVITDVDGDNRPDMYRVGTLTGEPFFIFDQSIFQNGKAALYSDFVKSYSQDITLHAPTPTALCSPAQMKMFQSTGDHQTFDVATQKLERAAYAELPDSEQETGWVVVEQNDGNTMVKKLPPGQASQVNFSSELLCYPPTEIKQVVIYHTHPPVKGNLLVPSNQDYYTTATLAAFMNARGFKGSFSSCVITQAGKTTISPNMNLLQTNPVEFYQQYARANYGKLKFDQVRSANDVPDFLKKISSSVLKMTFKKR